MAKKAYVGVNGIGKNVKKIYVGVNGVPKKVVKGYVGVNGVPKVFWDGGSPAPIKELSFAIALRIKDNSGGQTPPSGQRYVDFSDAIIAPHTSPNAYPLRNGLSYMGFEYTTFYYQGMPVNQLGTATIIENTPYKTSILHEGRFMRGSSGNTFTMGNNNWDISNISWASTSGNIDIYSFIIEAAYI